MSCLCACLYRVPCTRAPKLRAHVVTHVAAFAYVPRLSDCVLMHIALQAQPIACIGTPRLLRYRRIATHCGHARTYSGLMDNRLHTLEEETGLKADASPVRLEGLMAHSPSRADAQHARIVKLMRDRALLS